MTGPEERVTHEDGEAFERWFMKLMSVSPTCALRDILRGQKEGLWYEWKIQRPIMPVTKDTELSNKNKEVT